MVLINARWKTRKPNKIKARLSVGTYIERGHKDIDKVQVQVQVQVEQRPTLRPDNQEQWHDMFPKG